MSSGGKWSDQSDLDIRLGSGPGDAPAPAAASAPSWRRVPGPVWGLLALFVGLSLGSVYPQQLSPIGGGVKTAFDYLARAAPFIIYLTIVPALGDMLKTGSAAKFAGAVSLTFVLTTLIAGAWAVLVLTPLFQLSLVGGGSGGGVMDALGDVGARTVALAYTSEPFIAIWFAFLVGVFLHFGQRWRATRWFCGPTERVYAVVGLRGVEMLGAFIRRGLPYILFAIGVYIPTSVNSAVARSQSTIESSGGLGAFTSASPVASYFVSVGILVIILFAFLAVATWLVASYTRFPWRRIVKDYLLYVYPFAWATASSAASIPINLERTEKALGVRKEVRDFIIPLGATVNLDGTMMGAFVLTVIAGQLVGYTPTVLDLLLLIIPLTVVCIGVPGIPGGLAIIAPPVITSFLPIPVEQAPVFAAIFFGFSIGLSDQFRTGVNTCNNGLIARLFEHWYPRHFERAPAPAATLTPTAAGGAAPLLEREE